MVLPAMGERNISSTIAFLFTSLHVELNIFLIMTVCWIGNGSSEFLSFTFFHWWFVFILHSYHSFFLCIIDLFFLLIAFLRRSRETIHGVFSRFGCCSFWHCCWSCVAAKASTTPQETDHFAGEQCVSFPLLQLLRFMYSASLRDEFELHPKLPILKLYLVRRI